MTSGAITNRIDRVERMGLVERRPDAEDRRSYVIRLTPAGKKLADKAIANHITAVDVLLDTLSSGERTQLAGLLSKLLGSFENKAKQKRLEPGNSHSDESGRVARGSPR